MPTHLSKSGKVGWAIREDVIHSCSTMDRKPAIGGSSAPGYQEESPRYFSQPSNPQSPLKHPRKSPPYPQSLAHQNAIVVG